MIRKLKSPRVLISLAIIAIGSMGFYNITPILRVVRLFM